MQSEQAKKLISDAKNIYLVSSEEPESIACILALFYTLKESNKNVNLLTDDIPDKLKFLIPSLDFISFPRNLVISVPNNKANVSQVYYEKTDDNLKIHLLLNKGNLKKEDVSFYFSEPKPDLVITAGIENFRDELAERLNSYGFLLDCSIVNIDNRQNNQNFGTINLTAQSSLAEITNGTIDNLSKDAANCLLTSLLAYTNNFQNENVTAEVFELAAALIKKGADIKEIIKNIYGNSNA